MARFPISIVQSMQTSGAMVTCVPVQFSDSGDKWESAVFFDVSDEESLADRQLLQNTEKQIAIEIDAETLLLETAGVIMLRFEILTDAENPLAGEVLLAPGLGGVQFETAKLLTTQQYLRFFFADEQYQVIHSQQISLRAEEHKGFSDLLEEVVSHDAVLRLTGKYNAMTALTQVVDQYGVRDEDS